MQFLKFCHAIYKILETGNCNYILYQKCYLT